MKRSFSLALSLFIALSPLQGAFAASARVIGVIPNYAVGLGAAAEATKPIALPLPGSEHIFTPLSLGAAIAPSANEIAQPTAGTWPFPTRAKTAAAEKPKEDERLAGASGEAIRELLQMRRDVQQDARDILQEHMGGDVGNGALHKDVNRVVGRLVRAAGLSKEAAQSFIGNSFIPNAFTTIPKAEHEFIKSKASLGKPFRVSNVFMSLGLLRAFKGPASAAEAKLAFVLAHELYHNWKEHLKGFAGSHEMLGHFHEFEADFEALKLIARAGYDPRLALDTLYSLDKAFEELENKYALFSRKDKGEIAQAMARIRDVHPHKDLRRANLLDHLDEALELYKPAPIPENPAWMRLRDSAERPSALDRFEKRVRATVAGGSVDEKLHSLETFVEREKAKRDGFTMDEEAIVEEAYRTIIKGKPNFEDTRSTELSIERGETVGGRIHGELVDRQLALVIDRPGITLEDFLRLTAGQGLQTRKAGALRLMGQVKTRRELQAMYRALTRGAESLSLSAGDEESSGDGLAVATRLWRSTGRVLTFELGRTALPEEIIDSLKANLSPAWLRAYRGHLQVMIVDSAMELPDRRSQKFTPKQLILRLSNLDESRRESKQTEVDDDKGSFSGLSTWGELHHTPGIIYVANDRFIHRYERFRLEGHGAPSERDFLDLVEHFAGGTLPPPALIQLLKRDGVFDRYMLLAMDHFEEDLLKTPKALFEPAVEQYNRYVANLMSAALYGVFDLAETARVSQLVWERALKTHSQIAAKGGKKGRKSYEFAVRLLATITISVRVAVVRLNNSGARPSPESLAALAKTVDSIEETLGYEPAESVIAGHAQAVIDAWAVKPSAEPESRKARAAEKAYARAFGRAIPGSVILPSEMPGRKWWQRAWRLATGIVFHLYRVTAAYFGATPKPVTRSLRVTDLLGFLLMSNEGRSSPSQRAAAAALVDKMRHLDMHSGQRAEEVLSLVAAQTIGRWLLEGAVTQAKAQGTLPILVRQLLRLNELQPAILNPDHTSQASAPEYFRGGAEMIRRNEPYRTMARQEHPFRGVNARWGLDLMAALDEAKAWPVEIKERLDLLDFMNSSGEFSDVIDQRIIDVASSDPAGFRKWVKEDDKRIKRWGGVDNEAMDTPFGKVMVPRAAPLRIVRNPTLRAKLFDLLEEAKLTERAPRRKLGELVASYRKLFDAYRAARKFFSKEFLGMLKEEGSLENKFYIVVEEIDKLSRKEAEKWREDWDKGVFTPKWREALYKSQKLPDAWREALPNEKDEIIEAFRMNYQQIGLRLVYNLYLAFAGTQEPLVELIVTNYPEPTRSRDEILERVMKARRLSPGSLSFLEANKSYRQPNPVRVAEKQFLDQAVTHMRRFDAADRVDLVLHMSGLATLSKDRLRDLDRKFLNGDRRKLARRKAAIRSITQLKSYMTLLHPRDRMLLIRGLFFGENNLNESPDEVERLYETIVIKNRNLPKFVEEVFRAYFRALTGDEKAMLISNLAGITDLSGQLSGPEVVRIGLKRMGVTGAKIAQVLATHRGLLPPEYAAALEGFKDKAQDMPKMLAFDLMKERLELLAEDPGKARDVDFDMLMKLSVDTLEDDNPALQRRMARQVQFIQAEEGRHIRRIEFIGPELGSGSIKVVYKVELKDGRTWVVKLRAPGAKFRTQREFEIVDAVVADLEKSGALNLPGVHQLIAEVRQLVSAEMDFRDEAVKETGVRERANNRPWYARFLVGASPYVPKPHPVYQSEDLLVEEFVPTVRFEDLPKTQILGPSRRSISRRAVDEGMYAILHDEWLEPDAHTGNRYARKGWFYRLFSSLVIIDLGQGQTSPIARLKPVMRAGSALEGGDLVAAAEHLMSTIDAGKDPAKIRAAVQTGLAMRPEAGLVERLMDGFLEAEKSGGMIKPEYAALQKAFLIYAGYSEYLPKNGLYRSLERAAAARLLKDGKVSRWSLLKLGIRRLILGRDRTRAESEALIETL